MLLLATPLAVAAAFKTNLPFDGLPVHQFTQTEFQLIFNHSSNAKAPCIFLNIWLPIMLHEIKIIVVRDKLSDFPSVLPVRCIWLNGVYLKRIGHICEWDEPFPLSKYWNAWFTFVQLRYAFVAGGQRLSATTCAAGEGTGAPLTLGRTREGRRGGAEESPGGEPFVRRGGGDGGASTAAILVLVLVLVERRQRDRRGPSAAAG